MSNWTEENQSAWRPEPPLHLFPVPVLTGVSAVCAALFASGVAGNLLTVVVVAKYREMRSTTNLYLCSVALSDLLILTGMPLDLYRLWRYRPWGLGPALCKLFQYVSESCSYASILSLTALGGERYLAICRPLRARLLVTKRRVRALLLALWGVSLCSAAPVLLLVGVQRQHGECKATEYAVRSGLLAAMVWLSSAFFFLPVLCLSVLYGLIGRTLWRRRRRKGRTGQGASSRDKSDKQTAKMLAVVVFAFVLCWLPFHVGRYLISKSAETGSPLMSLISQYCNLVSFVLFYLSAAINPILYNTMSRKYRSAACRLFRPRADPRRNACGGKGEGSPGRTGSTVSV